MLNSPKSDTSSTFGLQTKQQIEREFKKQARQFRMREVARTRIYSQDDRHLKRTNSNLSTTSLTRIFKDCYNNPTKANSLISLKFKNKLIGAFFQALITKAIQSIPKQNPEDYILDNNNHQSIIRLFDIPKIKYELIRNQDDKVNFAVEHMKIHLTKSLDLFNKQQQDRQKSSNKQEELYQNKKQAIQASKVKQDSMNQQILIKSRFSALKIKLWKSIQSRLTEFQNMLLTHQALQTDTKVYQLHNFTGLSTEDVLFSEFAQNAQLSRDLHRSYFKNKRTRRSKTSLEWDQNQEQVFKEKTVLGKKLFYDKCNNKNIARIGIQDPIYRKVKEDSYYKQRDVLMDRYMNDEQLSAEEIKFLHDTCELVNRNIDKEFEKKKLNSLDSELVNQLELQVVQEIIEQFISLKIQFMKARKNYLKNQNNQKVKKLKEILKNKEDMEQFQKRKEELMRRKTLFRWKVDSMIDEKKFKHPNVKIYVKMFIEGLKNNVQLARRRKEYQKKIQPANADQMELRKKEVFFISNEDNKQSKIPWHKYFDQKQIQLLRAKNVNLRLIKNNYHPPSKLLITNETRLREDHAKEEKRFMKLLRDAKIYYENNYQIDDRFKEKKKFINFYTGGPMQKKVHPLETLHRCADMIKKHWKGYRIRKMFQEQLQEQENRLRGEANDFVKSLRTKKWAYLFYQLKTKKKNQQSASIQRRRSVTINQLPTTQRKNYSNSPLNQLREKLFSKLGSQDAVNFKKFTDRLTERQLLQQKLRALFRMAKFHKNEQQFLLTRPEISHEEVNMTDSQGFSALYYACKRGCLQVVKYILNDLQASLNQICKDGNTPLHVGFESNNTELIHYLIQRPDADFNILNRQGITALGMCKVEILQELGIAGKVIATSSGKDMKNNNNDIVKGSVVKKEQGFGEDDLEFKRKQMVHMTSQVRINEMPLLQSFNA